MDHVISRTAAEDVRARPSGEMIVAPAAIQRIVSASAAQAIPILVPRQPVFVLATGYSMNALQRIALCVTTFALPRRQVHRHPRHAFIVMG